MSTRSRIGIKTENKEIKSVYCHWGGYPSNNGAILLQHYDTKEKVENLIALGGMSSLHESIECPEGHTFDNPKDGHTVFYHRDRGEDWENNKPVEGIRMDWEEYAYLFDVKKNIWHYRTSNNGRWNVLTPKICKIKETV